LVTGLPNIKILNPPLHSPNSKHFNLLLPTAKCYCTLRLIIAYVNYIIWTLWLSDVEKNLIIFCFYSQLNAYKMRSMQNELIKWENLENEITLWWIDECTFANKLLHTHCNLKNGITLLKRLIMFHLKVLPIIGHSKV
jgi:hypothetical protein